MLVFVNTKVQKENETFFFQCEQCELFFFLCFSDLPASYKVNYSEAPLVRVVQDAAVVLQTNNLVITSSSGSVVLNLDC